MQRAMVGVELQTEVSAASPAIVRCMLEQGFIVDFYPLTSTIRLLPPSVVSTREINAFISALEQALAGVGPMAACT